MADEQTQESLGEIQKTLNLAIRLLREVKTALATATVQAVGTGEAVHVLVDRVEAIVTDAEKDTKEIGIGETRMVAKQEQLLDIQISNAQADARKKDQEEKARVRGIIKDYLSIFAGSLFVVLSILAFIKFYVKLP